MQMASLLGKLPVSDSLDSADEADGKHALRSVAGVEKVASFVVRLSLMSCHQYDFRFCGIASANKAFRKHHTQAKILIAHAYAHTLGTAERHHIQATSHFEFRQIFARMAVVIDRPPSKRQLVLKSTGDLREHKKICRCKRVFASD